MRNAQGQASPGEEEGPRRSFGGHTATHRQEERNSQAYIYVNPLGQEVNDTSDLQLGAVGDGYFKKVEITLVGAPDLDGRRERLVRDILWGRSRPDRGDVGPAARVPISSPPVL